MLRNFTKGILFLSIFAYVSCNKEHKKNTFYVGTYTDGESEGIYSLSIDENGKLSKPKLQVKTENPSFIAFSNDKNYIISANEAIADGSGAISSFKIEKNSLVFTDRISSEGLHPCHVSITDKNDVIVSNYTGGNVTLSHLSSDGKLIFLDSQKHFGSTEHPRQEAPHVHSSWIHPRNEDVIAVDLGTNELWFYSVDKLEGKLISKTQQKMTLDSVSGPRHLTFHPKNPNRMYVINELNSTISLVELNSDKYELKSSTSTTPENVSEENYCADIHISRDGEFLYASNRGLNNLAVFSVNQDSGELTLISFQDVHGKWPRNFSLSPNENYVLVANQHSSNIVSFQRNKETGLLTFVDEVEVPSPVCILF